MGKKVIKAETKRIVENYKLRQFKNIIKEEVKQIFQEVDARSTKIQSKLEGIRTKLIKNGTLSELQKGSGTNDRAALPEQRIPINTISELIEVPVNELLLHFLNGHRIQEGRQLVEYRLGCVIFYAEPKK